MGLNKKEITFEDKRFLYYFMQQLTGNETEQEINIKLDEILKQNKKMIEVDNYDFIEGKPYLKEEKIKDLQRFVFHAHNKDIHFPHIATKFVSAWGMLELEFMRRKMASISSSDKNDNFSVIELASCIKRIPSFSFDDILKEALLLTDNSIGYRHIPFREIVIETDFFVLNKRILGIYITETLKRGSESYEYFKKEVKEIKGVDIYGNSRKQLFLPEKLNIDFINEEDKDLKIIFFGIDFEDETEFYSHFNISKIEEADDFVNKDSKIYIKNILKIKKQITLFCINFLDFLEENKEYKISKKVLSEANSLKINSPPQISLFVEVRGKLKEQLLCERNKIDGAEYSHSFWVRGHFRHFKSSKYTSCKGKKIWIIPYIKGKGILIKKDYMVKR